MAESVERGGTIDRDVGKRYGIRVAHVRMALFYVRRHLSNATSNA